MKKTSVFLIILMGVLNLAHAEDGFRLEAGKMLKCSSSAELKEAKGYQVTVSHGSKNGDEDKEFTVLLHSETESHSMDADFDETSESFIFEGGSLEMGQDDDCQDASIQAKLSFEDQDYPLSCEVEDEDALHLSK